MRLLFSVFLLGAPLSTGLLVGEAGVALAAMTAVVLALIHRASHEHPLLWRIPGPGASGAGSRSSRGSNGGRGPRIGAASGSGAARAERSSRLGGRS